VGRSHRGTPGDRVLAGAAPAALAAAPPVSTRYVLVYVSGAVEKPGMYRLPSGLRVIDAVIAAGGLRADADMARMPNLAGRLSDGKQVKVPVRGSTGSRTAKLDINTATAAELATVPGIDGELAQQIVDFRDNYGPYASLTDLSTLLGLDRVFLATLRPYLTVSN
jgi:competence protein ComEA